LAERILALQRRCDEIVDVGYGAAHVQPAKPGAAITQVDRLAGAGRCTGRRYCTSTCTTLELHMDLNGRPPA
jgi:hypothetical protein